MQSRKVRGARTSLIALGIFVPVLYICFALISIVQDYHVTLEKAELEARSTSAALNEHANRAVGEADRFLLNAMGEIERSGLSASVDNESALHSLLKKYTKMLPQLLSISLVAPNGKIVANGIDSLTNIDVSDRDYFRFHRMPGNTGLFISHSYVSRLSNHWIFTISRSIVNADGSLKMVVVAGLPVDYFDAFYHSLSVGKGTHMLLVRSDDGTVLVESPVSTSHGITNILNTPLFVHYRQFPAGSFETDTDIFDGALSGASNVIAYAGSSDHPLLAVTSLSKSEVLMPWHNRVWQLAMLGTLTIGLLLALIRLLWGQLNELISGKANLEEKNESLALAAQVFETSLHAITILSSNGTILRANKAFSDITGYAGSEVLGHNFSLFENSFVEAELRTQIIKSLYANGSWQGEARLLTKAGDELIVKQSVSMLRNGSGAVQSVVAIFQDITEQKLSERRLHQLAHFDVLTNLPNRRTFSERIQHEIDLAVRHDTMLAVLFIDLDHFKTINDSLGHATGDLVLQSIAARLRGCLRIGDTVARLGGDEFVVLLEGNSKVASFERVATKLADSLKAAIDIDGREMYVAASMGISVFPQDGLDSETLLRNADTAMYRAKTAGRNCWRFFDESMARNATRRLELETALRRAAERNELVLYYQPQRSLHSERIVGVEALLRWERPDRGMISPMEFIPLAEESGLIIPIGDWVLLTACTQAAAWWRENKIGLRVAVNIAAKQIHHKGFVELVSDILTRTGLPPEFLELEITESSIIENVEETVNKLHKLKALGVTVAIDDFGTGYSSLSYLKQLPVDRLKIDRSFVKDTPDDADDCAIVRTIISMSHNLGMSVIAEGVETERQLDFLRAQHCDEIQGYLLSVPLPAKQITSMLVIDNQKIAIA
jgi:diguanylate cyclase (GGDEF)-like protein/PAS domain S-box-containing protein